jgi:hypothetical protein
MTVARRNKGFDPSCYATGEVPQVGDTVALVGMSQGEVWIVRDLTWLATEFAGDHDPPGVVEVVCVTDLGDQAAHTLNLVRRVDLDALSVEELLRLSRASVTELRKRGIVRTANSPAGDYAEWLVKEATGGELAPPSAKSYDVLAGDERLQVKSRVVTDPAKRSERQLSPFRSWDCDAVVIVLFDEQFGIRRMAQLPTEVVKATARWQEHVRGHIVFATDELLSDAAAVELVAINPE